RAAQILKDMGTPCLIHQPRYNLFDRWVEEDHLFDTLEEAGMGSIIFSPLAQGLLTDRYLQGLPDDSRAVRDARYFNSSQITEDKLAKVKALNAIAQRRGQSLAQMAIAWILIDTRVTSVLIGASKPEQIEDNVAALKNLDFSKEELQVIREIIT
ncbi:MAG TPA: aldo/keto reductase, partial [Saprospiraceae bacterium]|nr:aldo/keto reductase [Saprospiraceae bacterium]